MNLRRLDTILGVHAPDIDRIDILSVDVEGWELEVLDGLNMPRYRPRVMIIENLFDDKKYRSYMKNLDYVLWRTLPPNEVYVSRDFAMSGSHWWRRYFHDLCGFLRKWLP